MLMKYIDAIKCPVCKASKLWKLEGDFSDERMATGKIICPNEHEWQVQEEVFRLDEQNSEEAMQFLDHPLTGFPKQIGEKVRGEFLIAFQNYVEIFVKESDEPIIIIGSPVLFMRYLPKTEREIIVVNSSEGILRQVQEIAANKRIYQQVSVIRAENIEFLLPNAKSIYIFDGIPEKMSKNEIGLLVNRDIDADILWEEDDSILMIKK